jgi:tripartite ATP-independent transporter DctP family solute receptor
VGLGFERGGRTVGVAECQGPEKRYAIISTGGSNLMNITRRAALKTGLGVTAGGLAAPYIVRTGFAATPVRTLKMAFVDTVAHPAFPVFKRFAENVNKRTDGAIAVDVFGLGQLGSQVNMLTGLQTGIIDLCFHTSGFVQTLYPSFMVVDLPFLFSEVGKAEKMLDGPLGARLMAEFPSKGVYGLSYGWWGWRVVQAVSRAVPEPTDMRGLKIRVQPGAIYAAMFTTLGAIPVSIDMTEVYLALSQNTVGAVEPPIISVIANKLDEVIKVITNTNHVYNVGVTMASKRSLDMLDKKYQEAIRQAALEMTPDCRRTVAEASAQGAKKVAAEGIKMVEVDRPAYRKALEPVYQQFRPVIGADLMDAVLKAAA